MQDTPETAATEDRNPFRRAFGRGRPLVGTWSMLNSSNVVEGLGECGFDWVLIDGEHSPITLADMIAHLRAIAASDTVPIVRLPWNDPVRIKQALDIGATTLMLPYVQSTGEAQAAVAAMRYPPEGVRGVAAMHRASRFGADKTYLARANAGVALIVQIETEAALGQVEAIAATPGVDAVFFGPGDLAATMGHLGRPAAEPVVAAIRDARARLRGSGVRTGVLAPSPELAEAFIRDGFDFVSVANDAALLFSGAAAAAARFRTVAEGVAPR
ncbi:aldolase/citrate lyase family protein [Aquibium sp. A9E412]|uniref:HpcH/HpaI aldolase family protein n=1 Tax=Aquibium sp. A9E412 TaxID=2976767 RepID=UPI0025B207B3|nr:aldolase/citrate lyase family protein [Aquibium sp. A9E412]MDN2564850.1 aldolase/citrate lyase family protein [Aquibium sp. A9E412]